MPLRPGVDVDTICRRAGGLNDVLVCSPQHWVGILAARYPSPDLLASTTDNITLSYPTAVALRLIPGTKIRVLHKNKSAGGHNY